MFIKCDKCGKKLIQRLPSGLYRFKFGTPRGKDKKAVVDMFISGKIQMRCLRHNCNHVTVILC